MWRLLGAFPVNFRLGTGRRSGVRVLEFVGRDGQNYPFLIDPDQIREDASLDVGYNHFLRLVDGISAEAGDKSQEDGLILLGSPLVCRSGCNSGKIGTGDALCKVTTRIEHEDALGIGAPAVGLMVIRLHVEARDKCPGS